ncbi:MAG: SLBB domain-containing protein [Calditrichota bacterium]
MIQRFRSVIRFGVWFCGLALIAGHLSGYAQTLPTAKDLVGKEDVLEKLFGTKLPTTPTGKVFFEGAVDPDEYLVGPGDILDLVFWQPTYSEYPVTVNGDGDIIIPYVGVVHVADLTLRDAKTLIETTVARTLRIGKVTVSLMEPRQFRVHVVGMVEKPGTYVVPATGRVTDAILLAGGLKYKWIISSADTTFVPLSSERRIELRSRGGESLGFADLQLFNRSGLLRANPILRDGQTIVVPKAAGANYQIGIFGEVNFGGLHEYADGDQLATVLALAGGLTTSANSADIRVVSRNGDVFRADLSRPNHDEFLTHVIQPGDRIHVAGFPDTSRIGSVTLSGEVAVPGGYPIILGQTSLQDILREAGGLLPSAASNSARLIRQKTDDFIEPERDRVLAASLNFNSVTPAYKSDPELAAVLSRWAYGTVVLDLTDAMQDDSPAARLILQDGDVLDVPKTPMGVRVLGGVNNAGEVGWQPGKKLNYYIAEAGGLNRGGWKGMTMVIKARNGSQIRYQSSLSLDPGDVIFVPSKPQTTTWTLVKDFVAVTAQVATVVLIVQNLNK